jgi:hypothetical protein
MTDGCVFPKSCLCSNVNFKGATSKDFAPYIHELRYLFLSKVCQISLSNLIIHLLHRHWFFTPGFIIPSSDFGL